MDIGYMTSKLGSYNGKDPVINISNNKIKELNGVQIPGSLSGGWSNDVEQN